MLRQLVLCNGQKDGFECQHYWRQVNRMPVMNPDSLKKGQTLRYCKLGMQAGDEHPMALFMEGDSEMATECTEYRPDRRRRYTPNIDGYDPLTPEEIKALQDGKAVPRFQARKWWQFWRQTPSVEVVYLTPEEIAAMEASKLAKVTTSDSADGSFTSRVFDEKPNPLTDMPGGVLGNAPGQDLSPQILKDGAPLSSPEPLPPDPLGPSPEGTPESKLSSTEPTRRDDIESKDPK